MTSNLERFRKDLERLVNQAADLELSMLVEVEDKRTLDWIQKKFGKKKAEEFLKNIKFFSAGYEAWYSESLALLRQLLPDRVVDFISLYEKPKNRKNITIENYVIQDYLRGLSSSLYGEIIVDRSSAINQFRQQYEIVKAASIRFDSSLFEMRQLVQADLFDSELAIAKELLKHKFIRPAGVVAGVVLEKHLKQVCNDHLIKIDKKNSTISGLNELLKNNSIIETPQWRHIGLLADYRNLCGHNKDKEPTNEQVEDLINGIDKIIKTVS